MVKPDIKKGKFLKDAMIILGISLAILIASEIILRVLFPEKIEASNIFEPVAYEFNKDYLISLKPNIRKEYIRLEENGGYISHWQTNSRSFRGPELRDNPEYRVIVYGDSNVQARFSGRSRTFPIQLEHYLNKSGIRNIEVINAGVIGFGPDQSLIRFSKEVDQYKPDLVIFHVFADNDFGDIVKNRLFSLDADGNLIPTGFKKTDDDYLSASRRIKTFISQMLTVRAIKKMVRLTVKGNSSEALTEHSNKENVIDTLQKKCKAEYLVYKEARPRKFSHFGDHYDIDIALNPEQASSKIKIRLMEEVLKEANNLAHTKGVRFLVLIQPSVIDLTKDNAAISYKDLQKYPEYKRTNLTDAVERACTLHHINSINLFSAFMKNSPEDLFFRAGNDHWTDLGQKLAAKITAKYLIHHAIIESTTSGKGKVAANASG